MCLSEHDFDQVRIDLAPGPKLQFMPVQKTTPKEAIEIASVGGIVAILLFVEYQFGFFSWIAAEIAALDAMMPGVQALLSAFGIGSWIGLFAYSRRRRSELTVERAARREVEQEIEQLQIANQITGLPNRKGFSLVLEDVLKNRGEHHLTVLGIEVCNFDTIMSVHGSRIAEELECAIARHLISLAVPGDFMAHTDDATFYVIVQSGGTDAQKFHVDNLIEAICAFAGPGVEVTRTKLQVYMAFSVLSVGNENDVSLAAETWTVEDVIRRVEFSLHHARKKGHAAVEHFNDETESLLHQRAFVEIALKRAIEDDQIVPYFQPFIDLKTKHVVGFEVLARWTHASRGSISPGVFIPIAEEIGVLPALTVSVFRQACEAAKSWPDMLRLAVNISPTDLRDAAVVEKLMAILGETGIAPSRIEIEITENAFIEEADAIAEALSKVKECGISISIDDFGTGYSSLHHLRILPFDKIKIDQSFIKEMETDSESKAIVEAIIALGASLGLQTTAEGVELVQNEGALEKLGCAIGQGYLFARPLPASEVMGFLNNYGREVEKVLEAA